MELDAHGFPFMLQETSDEQPWMLLLISYCFLCTWVKEGIWEEEIIDSICWAWWFSVVVLAPSRRFCNKFGANLGYSEFYLVGVKE